MIADKFSGKVSTKKSEVMEIDGFTPEILGGFSIQVKQSEGVSRNMVDNFETAIRRINKKKGYLVAYSFVKEAYEEVARTNQDGLEIVLRTVQELIDGKVE